MKMQMRGRKKATEEELITGKGKWAMTKKEDSEGQMKLLVATGSKHEIRMSLSYTFHYKTYPTGLKMLFYCKK